MLTIYKPELKDYWYEKKINEDANSMSYNAGYDVSYYGYHYDTGQIDFPENRWEEVYNKRKNDNKRFFAYLKDIDSNEFVGYVNYQYDNDEDRYDCGIVIEYNKRGHGYAKEGLKLLCEEAKKNDIKELYDNFEKNRDGTQVFFDLGFEIVEETKWRKFNKDVDGIIVRKIL